MAHPSAQIKVDLILAKESITFGIAFMKVEKTWHGRQMTLTTAKRRLQQPNISV